MNDPALILTLQIAATMLPLASSVLILLVGQKRLGNRGGLLATTVMGLSFLCCVGALIGWMGYEKTIVWNVKWIPIGDYGYLYLGALVDGLTIAMMTMVSFVAFLVHIYSIGYMEGDKRYSRFFAYLSLFTFSMMGIVISNSIMQLFVFWELVGLTSYLLIGFWYENKGPQLACKKAFVMNRIGDAGFLIGFGILFVQLKGQVILPAAEGIVEFGDATHTITSMLGALANEGVNIANPAPSHWWLTAAGIGLFCGAIGKSAQFPLHTWLPDAMEGPTPVSSIVHSATMVAAGVYLTGRIYPILTPAAHIFVATIGLITLVMAAVMAMVMTDIKRVLAYSTLSQLGYMILGLGVGAWGFALFHLITHAFFKCCLFQCSGSVIHAAHHQQDMRYYGGLGKKMKVTMICYGVCMLAIAGASIPFSSAIIEHGIGMSGFYSKDGIIAGAFNYGNALSSLGPYAYLFWIGPVVIAYITPFYMARSFALTFLGKPRDEHLYDHAHEAPRSMLIPQVILATLAVVSGWGLFQFRDLIFQAEPNIAWIQTAKDLGGHSAGMDSTHLFLLMGFGWIAAIGAGIYMYKDGFAISSKIVRVWGIKHLHTWALNKFYFDHLYDGFAINVSKVVSVIIGAFDKFIVDGVVNLSAWLTRMVALLVGWFDNKVIDGAVNGAATFAHAGGSSLRIAQGGKVRGYVLLLFAAATLLMLIVITVVITTS